MLWTMKKNRPKTPRLVGPKYPPGWRHSCEHTARQSLKYKKTQALLLDLTPGGELLRSAGGPPPKHKALLLFVSHYTRLDSASLFRTLHVRRPSALPSPFPFTFPASTSISFFRRPPTATLVSPVCVRSFRFPLTSRHNHTDCLCQRLTFPNLCALTHSLTHTHTAAQRLVSFSAVLALVPRFLSLFSLQPLFSGPQSAPFEYSSTVLLSSSIFFTLAVTLAIITPVPSPPLITPLEANPKPFFF